MIFTEFIAGRRERHAAFFDLFGELVGGVVGGAVGAGRQIAAVGG